MDGNWPEVPETIAGGILTPDSIDFAVELAALYRGTRLNLG
jgi:hypothetical protein